MITIEQLIRIVKNAEVTKTVLTPHTNWYDEFAEQDITYIDADKMLEELRNLSSEV